MFAEILNTILSFVSNYLPKLIGSIIIVIIGFLVSKLLKRVVSKQFGKTKLDTSLSNFIVTAVDICFKIIVILSALANLGVSITGLVAAFSAAAVAVSLALKDSLSNIAAGIVMLISQPFCTGDYIDIQGDSIGGTVLRIDIIHTTLVTPDKRRVVIPNGQLVNKTVVDYSKETNRRMDLEFGISYQSDPEKAKEIICDTVLSHPSSLQDPAPFVRVSAHNDSAVMITVRVWCRTEDYWSLHFDLLEQIRAALEANGIKIPHNQLDVHIVEKNND